MHRRTFVASLAAGSVTALAGCASLGGRSTPERVDPPPVEARIEWVPDRPAYSVELIRGEFTAENSNLVSVLVSYPKEGEVVEHWAGTPDEGEAKEEFPLEPGDTIVVDVERRGTVRLAWQQPSGERSAVVDSFEISEQPTPTEN